MAGIETTYGFGGGAFDLIFPAPIIAERAPTTGDGSYELGQMWINRLTNIIYILTSYSGNAAQWQSGIAGSGTFTSVTATAGDITADVGNIVATAGDIIATAGSASIAVNITAVGGNISATAGSVSAGTSVTAATSLLAGTTVTSTDGDHVVGSTASSAAANDLDFKKSRAGGVITTGDALGQILFRGIGTGTTYVTGASISSVSSGTIGANRVAANLVFATHDDTASGLNAITRMTIASTGDITIAAPDSGVALTITAGGETITAGDLTLTAGNAILTAGNASIGNVAAAVTAPLVTFKKSRTGGVITSGDILGSVSFTGIGTGTTYVEGASITATSSGTVGANRVASNLVFATHDDSASGLTAITRMTIASTGQVTLATPDSGVALTITSGGETITAGDLTLTAGNAILTAGDVNIGNVAAGTTAPFANFKKSRAGGVITSGDILGSITFQGISTGTTYVTGASITATNSGTVAASRVASNLVFSTHPDSASGATPTTRMTIATTGAVTIATPDSGVGLTVSGGGVTLTAGDATVTNGNVIVSTATKGITLPGGPTIVTGAGAPGALVAARGSMYMRTDAGATSTSLYINTDGAATWVAVTTA